MIIRNNTAGKYFLSWYGKLGTWLGENATITVNDKDSQIPAFASDRASGRIIVVSYNSAPFDYVVQAELDSIGGGGDQRSGVHNIADGAEFSQVSIDPVFTADTYTLQVAVMNTTDAEPDIIPLVVTEKNTDSFKVVFSTSVPTANYFLAWRAESI